MLFVPGVAAPSLIAAPVTGEGSDPATSALHSLVLGSGTPL